MTGFGVLLRKELAEAWQTRRLPVVAGLFIVVGMVSPLTARYLREIMQVALGDQLTVPIPVPTALTAVEQLQKNLAQLGALAAIALAMGSVAGELDRGTAALVLAQPVTRAAFLAAKLAALGIVLAISVVLAAVVAWVYTAVLFQPQPVTGWLAMTGLSWLALFAWASLTFLASTATGSTMAAAGLGFVALVVISLGAVVPALDHLLPSGLTVPAIQLASGGAASVDVESALSAVVGTLILIGACLVGAVLTFRRREL
jgi:ABC-2 type transport system permease protein